jgi:transcriptional regulator
MGTRAKPGDLLQGTLDMLVMKALIRGPLHGYAVAEFIQTKSAEVFRVEEGALYPALHRLEIRGMLSSEWGVSGNNRRAKYYSLTPAGLEWLEREAERWRTMAAAIGRILDSK